VFVDLYVSVLTENGRKNTAESNPRGISAALYKDIKTHPIRVCRKQSKSRKVTFKARQKQGQIVPVSAHADIQLAGIYLADNHIRAPFLFALDLRQANLIMSVYHCGFALSIVLSIDIGIKKILSKYRQDLSYICS